MGKQSLSGKVALVTGATRGIGKGIALQLGQAGALVYITGRTLKSSNGSTGSLEDTANEIRERGGKCIPVKVDHENDQDIANLFQKIESEQNGQLDILVNNAYKGVEAIMDNTTLKFWETKPEIWDDINNVGLRNHYICTVYASRLMVPRKQGLIINISSYGGVTKIFNVAYGIGKSAVDRMAQDCGIELKKYGVTMLSLYPGAVKTELVNQRQNSNPIFEDAESVEFSGKVIAQMALDPNISKFASRCVLSAEYAQTFGIKDIDNRVILSYRQISWIVQKILPNNLKFMASFIPNFLKIPQFLLDIKYSKF